MHNPRIEVCVECGEDWNFARASCYHCGQEDHETRDASEVEERRTGGLDDDV